MTRDEIVTALRCCANETGTCNGCPLDGQDGALNVGAVCFDFVARQAADLIEKLAADRKTLINELCQYCGKYKQAHESACDGVQMDGNVMDAVKFLQERNRMYESGAATPSIGLEDDYNPERAVKIVEEWAAAHPRKTRQDVFLEQYPNAKTSEKGTLYICPIFVDKNPTIKYPCICSTNCSDCRREFWSQEAE